MQENARLGSTPPVFTVVVCTRGRGERILPTLDALADQDGGAPPVVVVEQSDEVAPAVLSRATAQRRLRLIHDDGRGLSRARNLAWRQVASPWVVFVDDDCLVDRDWTAGLHRTLAEHPDAAFVSPDVRSPPGAAHDGLEVATFPVERLTVRSGRWTQPHTIGFGVCMAVRRDWIERLGGWDERLGAGTADFPAAEDMDFNYRLLRAGGMAVADPRIRVLHDQWRTPGDLAALFRGYAVGWAGFACKQLRLGDVAGGAWLWWVGFLDPLKMMASALRRRSRLRLHIGWARLAGHLTGTRRGLSRSW